MQTASVVPRGQGIRAYRPRCPNLRNSNSLASSPSSSTFARAPVSSPQPSPEQSQCTIRKISSRGSPCVVRSAAAASAAGGASDHTPATQRKTSLFWNPIDAEIFYIVGPALIALILDPIMSLVDTALVGRICGSKALAGVGLAGMIWSFLAWLFGGWLSTVTTPKIAALHSQGRTKELSCQIVKSAYVALLSGTLVTAACVLGGESMIRLVAHDPGVVAEGYSYMWWRALAGPALLLQFVSLGVFRGLGDTRTTLFAAVIANICNFSLDIILMLGLGWGVEGAAGATSASQWVGALVLWALLFRKGTVRLSDLKAVPTLQEVIPLVQSGLALSIRSFAGLASVFSATGYVAALGAVPLAAHEILRQLYIFSILVFESFSIASQALVARAIGRGDVRRAQEVVRRLCELGLATGVGIGLGLWALRDICTQTFTREGAVVSAVLSTFPLMVVFLPLDALMMVVDGTILGTQEHGFALRSTVFGALMCVTALHFSQQNAPGLLTVWASLKCLTMGRLSLGLWRLKQPSFPLNKLPAAAPGGTGGAAAAADGSGSAGDSGEKEALPAAARKKV